VEAAQQAGPFALGEVVDVPEQPEGMAKVGLDAPEDHQGEPDDADFCMPSRHHPVV